MTPPDVQCNEHYPTREAYLARLVIQVNRYLSDALTGR